MNNCCKDEEIIKMINQNKKCKVDSEIIYQIEENGDLVKMDIER